MKFTYELAERLRDECFTDDERRLFTTVEGATYIDVADHLMQVYGNFFLKSDENKFIKDFAILKSREGKMIIKQLELYKEKIDELVDPELNIDKELEYSNDDTTGVTELERTVTDDASTGSFGYNFDELSIDNKSAYLTRGTNTRTNQENPDFDKKWKQDAFVDVGTRLVGKKEFDPNKVLQKEKALDVREAHYEVIPEERSPVENALGKEVFSTIQSQLTGEASNVYTASNKENLALLRQDKNQKLEGGTYKSDNISRFKNLSRKNQNEANLKSLRLQVLNIQSRFFTIFLHLFRLDY